MPRHRWFWSWIMKTSEPYFLHFLLDFVSKTSDRVNHSVTKRGWAQAPPPPVPGSVKWPNKKSVVNFLHKSCIYAFSSVSITCKFCINVYFRQCVLYIYAGLFRHLQFGKSFLSCTILMKYSTMPVSSLRSISDLMEEYSWHLTACSIESGWYVFRVFMQ